jgi:hypothetical protein
MYVFSLVIMNSKYTGNMPYVIFSERNYLKIHIIHIVRKLHYIYVSVFTPKPMFVFTCTIGFLLIHIISQVYICVLLGKQIYILYTMHKQKIKLLLSDTAFNSLVYLPVYSSPVLISITMCVNVIVFLL